MRSNQNYEVVANKREMIAREIEILLLELIQSAVIRIRLNHQDNDCCSAVLADADPF